MKRLIWLLAALLAYVGLAFGAVNINSATQAQLESLNGIGPVKAKAIIDYREKNGRFKSLEEIKNVSGIGDATFDKIKGDIALTGTTTVPKAAESPRRRRKRPRRRRRKRRPTPSRRRRKSPPIPRKRRRTSRPTPRR